jgi:hypothetical protein
MRHAPILLCLLLACVAPPSAAQSDSSDEPVANPARPTVSTPATLTPVGYLQFETGILGASDSPGLSSQFSLNEVTKLTVAQRLELLAASQPFAHSMGAGESSNAAGDTLLGAQFLVLRGHGAAPALATSYFHRVYAGDAPNLDVGGPSNSLEILVSADVKGFHYDANAMINELSEPPNQKAQFGQSLCVTHPLYKAVTLDGEVWHFSQPYLHGDAVGSLWAVSYAARKTLVFDAGFNRGLTSTSTRWEWFAGFTYLLPHRLWKE